MKYVWFLLLVFLVGCCSSGRTNKSAQQSAQHDEYPLRTVQGTVRNVLCTDSFLSGAQCSIVVESDDGKIVSMDSSRDLRVWSGFYGEIQCEPTIYGGCFIISATGLQGTKKKY